jgi:hypothetical protein
VAHIRAFELRDEQQPGTWSLAQGERSISFFDEQLDVGRGALVRLHHVIPVPDKEVPFADVLEFRHRRRDELLALRHHLEAIYQKVVVAGDGPLALNTEVEALERAISNHLKAIRERRFVFRIAGLEAQLNLVEGAKVAVAQYPLSGFGGALVTGLVAAVEINIGGSLKGHEPTSTPFRYISSYHDELF